MFGRFLRPFLLTVTVLAGAGNSPFAFESGHWLNTVAEGACIGSIVGQLILWIMSRQLNKIKKEEEPSSPNPQPKSGTSPSPSQSLYLTGGIVTRSLTVSNPHNSPSTDQPSPPQFQPEKRAVPVVGFRTRYIEGRHRVGIGPGWRLKSFNDRFGIWAPGVNVANCYAIGFSTHHSFYAPNYHAASAPDPNCQCGFYVLTDFDKVPFDTHSRTTDLRTGITLRDEPVTMMVGAVVGWGRVVQHGDEGWRAEKVQVIALLDCKVSPDHLRITQEVAECYGVPVVGRTALELLAKEYGDRLPTEVQLNA